jgi:hypothetical protein
MLRGVLVIVAVAFWLNYPKRRFYYLGLPVGLMLKMLILEYVLLLYWLMSELLP